jgi:hypothetical protein
MPIADQSSCEASRKNGRLNVFDPVTYCESIPIVRSHVSTS